MGSLRRYIFLTSLASCVSPRVELEGEDERGTGGQGGSPSRTSTVSNAGGFATGGTRAGGMPSGGGGTSSTTALGGRIGAMPRPIGEWLFDEGAGSFVQDSSGNRNTGRVLEGASVEPGFDPKLKNDAQWVSGHKGFGLQLDEMDDWVRVEDSDSLDSTGLTNMVSISAWVKMRSWGGEHVRWIVISQRHMSGTRLEQFFLGLSLQRTLMVGINFFYGATMDPFPLDRWTHVAMTYDGIRQCGFVAGNEVICHDVGWPIAPDETPFTMGAGINDTDVIENLDGAIDEVRLYNVALTPSEVAALAKP